MTDFPFVNFVFYKIMTAGCLSAVSRLPSVDFENDTFFLHARTVRAKMISNILINVFDKNTSFYFHNDTYHRKIDEISPSDGHKLL